MPPSSRRRDKFVSGVIIVGVSIGPRTVIFLAYEKLGIILLVTNNVNDGV